jgi:NADH-quinone oxidoreductase subunit J
MNKFELIHIAFGFFACQLVASALLVLFTRHLIHALLGFLSTLFAVAGLFVLVGADVIGVVQLIVYIGGVVVLTLFGILYTYQLNAKSNEDLSILNLSMGLVFFVSLLIYISLPLYTEVALQDYIKEYTMVQKIGFLWLTKYVSIFEIIGVILLIVLVGATWVAYSFKTEKNK